MAKSTTRTRRSQPRNEVAEPEVQENEKQSAAASEAPAATAVAAPPAESAPAQQQQQSTSEDVASFDAETNAKYEQVKGGKLFIKDLQQMDVHQLHEIAKAEGIPDYIGMKKQDLIFIPM